MRRDAWALLALLTGCLPGAGCAYVVAGSALETSLSRGPEAPLRCVFVEVAWQDAGGSTTDASVSFAQLLTETGYVVGLPGETEPWIQLEPLWIPLFAVAEPQAELPLRLEQMEHLFLHQPAVLEAVRVRGRMTVTSHPTFMTYVSMATLCLVPGWGTTAKVFEGEIELPEGRREPFRFACTDIGLTWLPLLPMGFGQMGEGEGRSAWLWNEGYWGDVPKALVALLLEKGLL